MSILEVKTTRLPALSSINPIFVRSPDRGAKYMNGSIFIRITEICPKVFNILTFGGISFMAYLANNHTFCTTDKYENIIRKDCEIFSFIKDKSIFVFSTCRGGNMF